MDTNSFSINSVRNVYAYYLLEAAGVRIYEIHKRAGVLGYYKTPEKGQLYVTKSITDWVNSFSWNSHEHKFNYYHNIAIKGGYYFNEWVDHRSPGKQLPYASNVEMYFI